MERTTSAQVREQFDIYIDSVTDGPRYSTPSPTSRQNEQKHVDKIVKTAFDPSDTETDESSTPRTPNETVWGFTQSPSQK